MTASIFMIEHSGRKDVRQIIKQGLSVHDHVTEKGSIGFSFNILKEALEKQTSDFEFYIIRMMVFGLDSIGESTSSETIKVLALDVSVCCSMTLSPECAKELHEPFLKGHDYCCSLLDGLMDGRDDLDDFDSVGNLIKRYRHALDDIPPSALLVVSWMISRLNIVVAMEKEGGDLEAVLLLLIHYTNTLCV